MNPERVDSGKSRRAGCTFVWSISGYGRKIHPQERPVAMKMTQMRTVLRFIFIEQSCYAASCISRASAARRIVPAYAAPESTVLEVPIMPHFEWRGRKWQGRTRKAGGLSCAEEVRPAGGQPAPSAIRSWPRGESWEGGQFHQEIGLAGLPPAMPVRLREMGRSRSSFPRSNP